MSLSQHENEIIQILKMHCKSTAAEKLKLQKYIGTQLKVLNISTPLQRKIFKSGFSFSDPSQPLNELEIWNKIWQESNLFEIKNMACYFIESQIKNESLLEHWPMAQHWAKNIDNWAHSDALSKFYARCLETHTDKILPILQIWNVSLNPWLRRQSIVSLLYYSSARKNVLDFETMISLVQPLLKDEHFYVQRGVGWTLRELGNVYSAKTVQFLKKNVTHLSSIAFSAATEKLDASIKEKLKQERKLARSLK